MHLMHALFGGTTQAAAVVCLRGRLDVSALAAAVLSLRADKQILRAGVEEVSDALWFRERSKSAGLPLTIVRREDDDHWRRLLETENSRALSGERGLWHVFVLLASPDASQEHELVFLSHHALVDAVATHAFLDELLQEAAVPRGEAGTRVRCIAEPAEALFLAPSGNAGGSWQQFEARSSQRAEQRAQFAPIAHATRTPVAERVTKVIPIVPSTSACASVERQCARLGVAASSYLAALYLAALRHMLPEREQVVLNTAMSLREYTGGRVQPQDLGCYLSVVSTPHNLAPGKSIDALAREHQRAFALSALVHGQNPTEIRLDRLKASMDVLAGADRFLLDFGIAHVNMPLEPRYGSLEVCGFFSSANRAIGSAAAILHSVQLRDRFFLTINYTSPLQSDEWAQALARELAAVIEAPQST
jgi:hypothetical protein